MAPLSVDRSAKSAFAQVVGETLDAAITGFGTMLADDETLEVARGWSAPGAASVVGRHRLADYGDFVGLLRRGHDGRQGVDALRRQIRKRRRELQRRGDLAGTLDRIRQQLDQVLAAEREQLAGEEGDQARLDEMQLGRGVRREADHVPGVGRDLRMHEHDGEHGYRDVPSGGSVRATTHASTRAAPARKSTPAAASSVAPVVITSSTSARCRPSNDTRLANTPRTLARLRAQGSVACAGAFPVRTRPETSGSPVRRATTRAPGSRGCAATRPRWSR